jgi:hypothetical protein
MEELRVLIKIWDKYPKDLQLPEQTRIAKPAIGAKGGPP